MSNDFWVVGGEYTDCRFEEIVSGTEQMFGPFHNRGDALSTWRKVAEETRSICMVRYVVVGEGLATQH